MGDPETQPRAPRLGTRVLHGLEMNLLSQASVFVANLLLTPLIVRGLGEDGYGIYSLLWVVVGYLNLLGLGTQTGAQRFVALRAGVPGAAGVAPLLRQSLVLALTLSLLGGALLWTLRDWVASGVLGLTPALAPTGSWVLACAAAAGPAYCLLQLGLGILVGRERFGAYAVLSALQAVGTLVLGAALLKAGYGLRELAGWSVAVVCALAAAALWLARGDLLADEMPTTEGERREFFSFSLRSWGTQVLWTAAYQGDRFLVGSLLSVSQLGYYSIAASIAQKFNSLCLGVSLAATPILTQLHGQGDEARLRRFYLRTTELSLFLSLPIAILSFVLAPRFLMIWLGSEFSRLCTWPFRALVVANAVYLLMFIPSTVAVGAGAPQVAAYLNLGRVAVLAVAWPLLIPKFGIFGAALGMLAAEALVSPIFLWRVHRTWIRLGWWEYWADGLYRPTVAGLALAALGYAVHGRIWGWAGLFATGASGLALYWAVAYSLLDGDARSILAERVKTKLGPLLRST